MSWPSWSADVWGNVIAAAAVFGGILTFVLTTTRDRAARKAEAKSARDAELRVQSRDSLVRVMEAALVYLEAGEEDWKSPRLDRNPRARIETRSEAIRTMSTAALLVHDKPIRESIYQGIEALRLSRYMAVHDEWEPEDQALRLKTIAEDLRDIAATYLRDDAGASMVAQTEIRRLLQIGREARELLFAQEVEERVAARAERRQAMAEEKAASEVAAQLKAQNAAEGMSSGESNPAQ